MSKGLQYGKFLRSQRPIKLCDVRCTVTTADGKTEAVKVTVAANKLNQLNGNSLSAKNCYELAKKGRTETKDIYGNHFVYELLIFTPPVAEEAKNEPA